VFVEKSSETAGGGSNLAEIVAWITLQKPQNVVWSLS